MLTLILLVSLVMCIGAILFLIFQCRKLRKEIDNMDFMVSMSTALNEEVTIEKADIETLSTQVSVPLYELSIIGNDEIPERIAHLISNNFIFELARRHLISYESTSSPIPDEGVFRATIQVVKPKF